MVENMSSFDVDEAYLAIKREIMEKNKQSKPADRPLEVFLKESGAMTESARPSQKPDGFRGIGIDIYGKPIIRTQSKPFGRRNNF